MGKQTPDPITPETRITILGLTDWRGTNRPFGCRRVDRRAHLYLVGKTGVGKSTLLRYLLRQDMGNLEGCALLDPHGDLAEHVAGEVPDQRLKDLVYFDAADLECDVRFNPLEWVPREYRSLAASGVLETFKKLWRESWGPRLEHLLRNAILALLEYPGATLGDILKIVSDDDFRNAVATVVSNEQVRKFWTEEFENYSKHLRADAIAPLQNKVGAFLADERLNRILTSPKSSFNLRKLMDSGGVLLVNLAKGKMGSDAAGLLGALLVTAIGVTAMGRADQAETDRRDFFVYLDEFQTFTTQSLVDMMAELRKYRVSFTMAHQYLDQLDQDLQHAILGNVGNLISFRVGARDAEILEREFGHEVEAADLIRLPNHHGYVRLQVHGEAAGVLSALMPPS